MSTRSKVKFDIYLLGLMLILSIFYLIGMKVTGAFGLINEFDNGIVINTAQVARNTIRGDFFVTKYILPVSYSYFPYITGHPDFIRYPFQILLYSFLFLLFYPTPIVIKLLNSILFLVNGGLIYKLVLKIQNIEEKETDEKKTSSYRMIAMFTAVTASLVMTYYFKIALSDRYEVITFTLLLITINVLVNRNTNPFFFGILCGLLYLSKPNLSLFVAVFTIYYLVTNYSPKKWIISGIGCVLGFLFVNLPFIIRSFIYTGEPMFALQHQIDIIKDIVLSHDDLYKSFSSPPSIITTILNNKTATFLRWQRRVIGTLKNLVSKDNIISWIGLPFFLFYFKKSRWLVYSYLVFLFLHIVIVANYLVDNNIVRGYSIILGFLVVVGSLGLYKTIFSLINKLDQSYFQNLLIILTLISLLSLSAFTNFHDGLKLRSGRKSIPDEVIEKIHDINPPCLYSNVAAQSVWDIDIPTIYKPSDNFEMLTAGPGECKFLLLAGGEGDDSLQDFLSHNSALIFQHDVYGFYRLLE